jgi:hypothetical protein
LHDLAIGMLENSGKEVYRDKKQHLMDLDLPSWVVLAEPRESFNDVVSTEWKCRFKVQTSDNSYTQLWSSSTN